MSIYQAAVYPLLRQLTKPNAAHERAVALAERLSHSAMGLGLAAMVGGQVTSERLRTTVAGIDLPNPIMLAAGFDKDARAAPTLHRLGFGAVVVGTVLPKPQPGNPHPTLFRPAPDAILNRMGFPSAGLDVVEGNLQQMRPDFPLGASLGINKFITADDAPAAYAEVAAALTPFADFYEINVSSPNTPGLRDLQGRDHLEDIIGAVQARASDVPLFVKIAPDLTFPAIDEVIEVVIEHRLAGIVATNTTTNSMIKASLGGRWVDVAGGVSGVPLQHRATEVVRHIAAESEVTVIGVGGIHDLDSLLEKFRAGASAVQLWTALVTHGPGVAARLNRQLDRWMRDQGVAGVGEIASHA